jgi:hypothetical protein
MNQQKYLYIFDIYTKNFFLQFDAKQIETNVKRHNQNRFF